MLSPLLKGFVCWFHGRLCHVLSLWHHLLIVWSIFSRCMWISSVDEFYVCMCVCLCVWVWVWVNVCSHMFVIGNHVGLLPDSCWFMIPANVHLCWMPQPKACHTVSSPVPVLTSLCSSAPALLSVLFLSWTIPLFCVCGGVPFLYLPPSTTVCFCLSHFFSFAFFILNL